MSYALSDFEAQLILAVGKFYSDPNEATELNTIRIALGGDATTRDTTIQRAPSGLQPGNRVNSPFTNAILKLINRGKGGNLSTISMANIIGGITSSPPINTVPPAINYVTGGTPGEGGATYARNAGTWTPPGSTYTQQWLRNGTAIAGATGTTYITVVADVGTSLSCAVTATNTGGSTTMNTNSIAIS